MAECLKSLYRSRQTFYGVTSNMIGTSAGYAIQTE